MLRSENILRGYLRSTRRQRSKQLNLAFYTRLLPGPPSYRVKCTGDRRTIRSYRVDSRHVTFHDDRSRRYLAADSGFVVPLVWCVIGETGAAATTKFIFRPIPCDNCPQKARSTADSPLAFRSASMMESWLIPWVYIWRLTLVVHLFRPIVRWRVWLRHSNWDNI